MRRGSGTHGLARRLVGHSHGTFTAGRQARTERDADLSGVVQRSAHPGDRAGQLGTTEPTANAADCERVLAEFRGARVDVEALAAKLQEEGAASFVASWNELLPIDTASGLGRTAGPSEGGRANAPS